MNKYDVYFGRIYYDDNRARVEERPAVFLDTLPDGRHIFLKITHTENRYSLPIHDYAEAGLKEYNRYGQHTPSFIQPLSVRVLEDVDVLNRRGFLSLNDQIALTQYINGNEHSFIKSLQREMER